MAWRKASMKISLMKISSKAENVNNVNGNNGGGVA